MAYKGTTTEQIAHTLKRMGYSHIELYYATGAYKRADVARWHGWVVDQRGVRMFISSWATMTECLRSGFTVEPYRDPGSGPWTSSVELNAEPLPRKANPLSK